MPRGAPLAPLVCCLALGLAPAQDEAQPPLLTQWFETYQAGRKVGWEHVQVAPDPAGDLRVTRRAWTPLERGVLIEADVAHVDSRGHLTRWARSESGPGPDVRWSLEPGPAGALRVERRLASSVDPPTTAEVPGPILDWRVLGLRWARGADVTGPRHAYLLEVPGLIARPLALTVSLRDDGLRLEAPSLRVDYGPDGRVLRVDHREQIATLSLPCAEAEARDPDRARPPPRGLGADGQLPFPLHGLELRPPTPAWRLTRQAITGGLELGLAHPSGTRVRVIHLPDQAPPRDQATCLRIAAALVADPPRPRLVLSDPRLGTHGDGLAVVFRWRERRRTLPPPQGEAMLIAGREGGLLVLGTAPAGAAPPHAALAGIRPLPTRRETITLTQIGLRFAVPKRWDELEPGDYVSPDRLARFTVERVEVPILTKPSAYQRQLLGNLTRLVADAHTDDRRGELAGRPGRLVTIRGIVRGQSPTPLPARIHCAIFVDEQVLTAVTAVAIGTGRAGVELDDTWASAQWRATLLESAPEAR